MLENNIDDEIINEMTTGLSTALWTQTDSVIENADNSVNNTENSYVYSLSDVNNNQSGVMQNDLCIIMTDTERDTVTHNDEFSGAIRNGVHDAANNGGGTDASSDSDGAATATATAEADATAQSAGERDASDSIGREQASTQQTSAARANAPAAPLTAASGAQQRDAQVGAVTAQHGRRALKRQQAGERNSNNGVDGGDGVSAKRRAPKRASKTHKPEHECSVRAAAADKAPRQTGIQKDVTDASTTRALPTQANATLERDTAIRTEAAKIERRASKFAMASKRGGGGGSGGNARWPLSARTAREREAERAERRAAAEMELQQIPSWARPEAYPELSSIAMTAVARAASGDAGATTQRQRETTPQRTQRWVPKQTLEDCNRWRAFAAALQVQDEQDRRRWYEERCGPASRRKSATQRLDGSAVLRRGPRPKAVRKSGNDMSDDEFLDVEVERAKGKPRSPETWTRRGQHGSELRREQAELDKTSRDAAARRDPEHTAKTLADMGERVDRIGWAQFLLDSGANISIVNSPKLLHEMRQLEPGEMTVSGINGATDMKAQGKVKIRLGEDTVEVKAYYSPATALNVVSMWDLLRAGHVSIRFENEKTIYVYKRGTNEVMMLLTTEDDSGLAFVQSHCNGNGGDDRQMRWGFAAARRPQTPATGLTLSGHKHYTHPSDATVLVQMYNDGLLPGALASHFTSDAKHEFKCVDCLQAKARENNYADRGGEHQKQPGLVLSGDMAGPFIKGVGGSNMFMVVYIELTGMLEAPHGYNKLPTRNKALSRIRFYAARAKDGEPVSVRLDGAGELAAEETKKSLEAAGISLIHSTPNTPQTNGAAERAVAIATQAMRTVLLSSGLSECFWPQALDMAMRMRTATKKAKDADMSLRERHGLPTTNVGRVLEFGTLVYAKLTCQTDKLGNRAVPAVYLGPALENAHKVMPLVQVGGAYKGVAKRTTIVRSIKSIIAKPGEPQHRRILRAAGIVRGHTLPDVLDVDEDDARAESYEVEDIFTADDLAGVNNGGDVRTREHKKRADSEKGNDDGVNGGGGGGAGGGGGGGGSSSNGGGDGLGASVAQQSPNAAAVQNDEVDAGGPPRRPLEGIPMDDNANEKDGDGNGDDNNGGDDDVDGRGDADGRGGADGDDEASADTDGTVSDSQVDDDDTDAEASYDDSGTESEDEPSDAYEDEELGEVVFDEGGVPVALAEPPSEAREQAHAQLPRRKRGRPTKAEAAQREAAMRAADRRVAEQRQLTEAEATAARATRAAARSKQDAAQARALEAAEARTRAAPETAERIRALQESNAEDREHAQDERIGVEDAAAAAAAAADAPKYSGPKTQRHASNAGEQPQPKAQQMRRQREVTGEAQHREAARERELGAERAEELGANSAVRAAEQASAELMVQAAGEQLSEASAGDPEAPKSRSGRAIRAKTPGELQSAAELVKARDEQRKRIVQLAVEGDGDTAVLALGSIVDTLELLNMRARQADAEMPSDAIQELWAAVKDDLLVRGPLGVADNRRSVTDRDHEYEDLVSNAAKVCEPHDKFNEDVAAEETNRATFAMMTVATATIKCAEVAEREAGPSKLGLTAKLDAKRSDDAEGQLKVGDVLPKELRGPMSLTKMLRSRLETLTAAAIESEMDAILGAREGNLQPISRTEATEKMNAYNKRHGRPLIVEEELEVLPAIFVAVVKVDIDNKITKVKVRMVADGSKQSRGDAAENYASGVTTQGMKACLAYAAAENWVVYQGDIANAYLQAPIKIPTFLTIKGGITQKINATDGQVLALTANLYGTLQGAKCWNDEISGFLKKKLGLSPSIADPSVYIKKAKDSNKPVLIVACYVDDLIVSAAKKEVAKNALDIIAARYKLSSSGELAQILGIRALRDAANRTILLSQEQLINEIADDMGATAAPPTAAPGGSHKSIGREMRFHLMAGSVDTRSALGLSDSAMKDRYRTVVGKALFVSGATRPDIAAVVSMFASHSANPTWAQFQALHDLARYLKGTRTWSLVVGGKKMHELLNCDGEKRTMPLKVSTDASWFSNNTDGGRSRTGYVVGFGGSPLAWSSKMQKTIAGSAAEAEINALMDGVREAVWVAHILQDFGIGNLYIDAQIDYEPVRMVASTTKARHVGMSTAVRKISILREMIAEDRTLRLSRVPGKDNPADLMTKCVHGAQHTTMVRRLAFMDMTNTRRVIGAGEM